MKIIKILVLSLFLYQSAFGIRLIRDAEIESILTEMTIPIFKVAGLKTKSLRIFVINSDEINAFTIGGGYIFINSGLILKISDPLQMMAIISHETAHIAAGHINRLMSTLNSRSRNITVAMLAGLLATVLTGSGEALAASMGYIMADERFFLKYSRGEEFAADALGASYLEKLGYSPKCMISVFRKFQNLDILNGGEYIPEYIKSHPNPDERINAIKNRNYKKELKKDPDENLVKAYNRVLVKLKAYLKDFENVKDDYSQAIYCYRHGYSDESIRLLQNLVSKNPNNIFYKETLAQCFYKFGRINEAIKIYEQIYKKDINPLIRMDYAEALIEANQNLDKAIKILEVIKYEEPFEENTYRLLAKAYGKQNKLGVSHLMLAYEQILLGDYHAAEKSIELSLKHLNPRNEKVYVGKAKYLNELIQREKDRRN